MYSVAKETTESNLIRMRYIALILLLLVPSLGYSQTQTPKHTWACSPWTKHKLYGEITTEKRPFVILQKNNSSSLFIQHQLSNPQEPRYIEFSYISDKTEKRDAYIGYSSESSGGGLLYAKTTTDRLLKVILLDGEYISYTKCRRF